MQLVLASIFMHLTRAAVFVEGDFLHKRSAEQEARLCSSNHCRLREGGKGGGVSQKKRDKEVNVAFADVSGRQQNNMEFIVLIKSRHGHTVE